MEDVAKAAQVRSMFGSIAGRYDLTNAVLSGGIHHLWKRRVVREVSSGSKVLDLCTGTGDLLPLLAQRTDFVVGGDFCRPMLDVARVRGFSPLLQCDALRLPFCDGAFDVVTVAFGVRNFADLESGLREIARVVRPGGRAIILEFGRPTIPLWREVYAWYSRVILPRIGAVLTGNADAYRYLPETAARFPCGEQFLEILYRSGFARGAVVPLTGGIAYLYAATRP